MSRRVLAAAQASQALPSGQGHNLGIFLPSPSQGLTQCLAKHVLKLTNV